MALALWLSLLVTAPSARADDAGIRQCAWQLCDREAGQMRCRPAALGKLHPTAPVTVLASVVDVPVDRTASTPPLMVDVAAMASSEVYWNGVLIGRNGTVGVDAAHEIPGRFNRAFAVPPELLKPGRNTLVLRLSSHHRTLPIVQPFHYARVLPYADPAQAGLRYYLPSLLMMGALLLAALYFGGAALLDRSAVGSALLCGIAVAGMAQLAAETARVFVPYAYPWQPIRLAAIAGLSGLTAVLIAAFAARRFAPQRRWLVTGGAAFAVLLVLVLARGFDAKALLAFLVGVATMLGCALAGARRGLKLAWPTAAASAVVMALAVTPLPFLDIGYYLALGLVLSALVASQTLSLRDARRDRLAADQRAEALKVATPSLAIVQIRDGRRIHRVAEDDILFLKAADDYCEVHVSDGRRLLWTATLAAALAELPEGFVRIHRSYAVNRARVTSMGRDAGGRLRATLRGGETVPIGRAYADALSNG